jgi:hypothetical protein
MSKGTVPSSSQIAFSEPHVYLHSMYSILIDNKELQNIIVKYAEKDKRYHMILRKIEEKGGRHSVAQSNDEHEIE